MSSKPSPLLKRIHKTNIEQSKPVGLLCCWKNMLTHANHAFRDRSELTTTRGRQDSHTKRRLGIHGNADRASQNIGAQLIPVMGARPSTGKAQITIQGSTEKSKI